VDTDFVSLFHFPHHCIIWHCGWFINISRTVTSHFSQNLAKWLTPTREWIHYVLGTIQWTPGSGSNQIIQDSNPLSVKVLVKWLALMEMCCLRVHLVFLIFYSYLWLLHFYLLIYLHTDGRHYAAILLNLGLLRVSWGKLGCWWSEIFVGQMSFVMPHQRCQGSEGIWLKMHTD